MLQNLLNLISFVTAIRILVFLNSIVLVFHLFVLFQIIPYTIVWAGKLNSLEEMYAFESVSILVNLILLIVVLIRGNIWKVSTSKRLLDIILWIFVFIFALNTIGNLFAATSLELYLATPLTFFLFYLCLRITSQVDNYIGTNKS